MTLNFVPFAAMTDAEQREHLRVVHQMPGAAIRHLGSVACHVADHRFDHNRFDSNATPHTHDKPARRDT